MANKLNLVSTSWTPDLSYVIGIITTDGNLSSDLRHLNITSKDFEIVDTCKHLLSLKNKIGKKGRGGNSTPKYYVLQFGSKSFFNFLVKLGLTPNKSKTLGELKIPTKYFSDFLRGCIDGDGSITESWHFESRQPQLKIRLCSASRKFLDWINFKISQNTKVKGGWLYHPKSQSVSTLCFGKADSIKILKYMYYNKQLPCLGRKKLVAERFM